jgi:hypothetical protein
MARGKKTIERKNVEHKVDVSFPISIDLKEAITKLTDLYNGIVSNHKDAIDIRIISKIATQVQFFVPETDQQYNERVERYAAINATKVQRALERQQLAKEIAEAEQNLLKLKQKRINLNYP